MPYLATSLIISSVFVIVCQIGLEIFDTIWLIPITVLAAAQAIVSVSVNFAGRNFDYGTHRKFVAGWRPGTYPSVDIYLPICGEDIEVIQNTWQNVGDLVRDYPGHCAVFVLDDAADPEARDLAEAFQFWYIVRPDRGRMRKSGNLRHAFAHTHGEYILILDADFAPRSDLLTEVLPYMAAYPQVGIVQTPQFFRTAKKQTWVERAGNAVQEIFYRNIQVARDHFGTSVCCGTCAVYRRTALEPDGGFAEVPYAEDEHTGLNVRRNGFSVRYLPVSLASGMSPITVDGFVRQQYRWCSGTFSTLRRWPRAGIRPRLTYAAGFFYYLYSAAMVFAGPAVPVMLLAFFPTHTQLRNYLVFAPVMLSGMLLYPLWHRCDYGASVWPLAIIRGWSHLLAIVDYVTGHTMQWQVTGSGASPVRRLWAGVFLWNCGTAVIWLLLAVYRTMEFHTDRFAIIGALGLFYAGVVLRVVVPSSKTRANG